MKNPECDHRVVTAVGKVTISHLKKHDKVKLPAFVPKGCYPPPSYVNKPLFDFLVVGAPIPHMMAPKRIYTN